MKELPVLVNYNIDCVIFFFFLLLLLFVWRGYICIFLAINWAIRNGEGRDM